ncbi:MAG TPA: hypothetical protein VMU16_11370 [Candidatus Binataceae bacterium]|nr:hypothetical protein [Candidatus Binataceae bacterium]
MAVAPASGEKDGARPIEPAGDRKNYEKLRNEPNFIRVYGHFFQRLLEAAEFRTQTDSEI